MSHESELYQTLEKLAKIIHKITLNESDIDLPDSNELITLLYNISQNNQKQLRIVIEIFAEYFDSIESEENKDHQNILNIINSSCDKNLAPIERFNILKPLLYIIPCLSDTIVSSMIHNLVGIFNLMKDDIPIDIFQSLNELIKFILLDWNISIKLRNSCSDYLKDEFENLNSPGSALAFSLILPHAQTEPKFMEFTDFLIKYCFKSEVEFQCIACFLLLVYARTDSDYVLSLPGFIFDNLKNFILSENHKLQYLAKKTLSHLMRNGAFNDVDSIKSLFNLYSYFDDISSFLKILTKTVYFLKIDFMDEDEDPSEREEAKYMANLFHEKISNEKTSNSEKDAFLFLAGVLLSCCRDAYINFYEDDFQIALSMIDKGYLKGASTFLSGASVFHNKNIRNAINSHINKFVEFASNESNDALSRTHVIEAIVFIATVPQFHQTLLPQVVQLRERFLPPNSIASSNDLTPSSLAITQNLKLAHCATLFIDIAKNVSKENASIIGSLMAKILMTTDDPLEFDPCLKAMHILMKFQKIDYTIAKPVIDAILTNEIRAFHGVPMFLYSGSEYSTYLSKFLASYIGIAPLHCQDLLQKLIEWFSFSTGSYIINVLRPIVKALQAGNCVSDEQLLLIASKINELSSSSNISFPDEIQYLVQAAALILTDHPDVFKLSDLFELLINVDINDLEEEEDMDDIYDPRALFYPYKLQIAFLILTKKKVNNLNDGIVGIIEDGIDYMFMEPKLGISSTLLALSVQVLKMQQSKPFRSILCNAVIDFIFMPSRILKNHKISDGEVKEVIDSLVSLFKEKRSIYSSAKLHCESNRSKYMMFNSYFKKLD